MEHVIEAASRVSASHASSDPEGIARSLGVEVYELLDAQNLEEVYFPKLAAIALRPGLPRHRRRYLVAHALGHHVLHQNMPDVDYIRLHSSDGCGRPEAGRAQISRTDIEADLFATYLLVQDEALNPFLDEGWMSRSEDPSQVLAIEFQVPVEAMRVRLTYEKCRMIGNQT